MAGRQPLPPSRASSGVDGSSTSAAAASSTRKMKSANEELEESEKGPTGSNGGQVRATTRQQQQLDEGSDCDELGDSDSDRGQADQNVKRKSIAATTSSSSRGVTSRGRGRPSAASASAKANAPSTAESRRASLGDSREIAATNSGTPPVPSKRSPPLATDQGSASDAKPRPTTEYSRQAPRSTAANSSSAPYYYSSAREVAPSTRLSSHKSNAAAASNAEDLTMHEVDKFLDLIEKHNLHTSNEDDMARSVTELYQEWLEWCAKRSVQSTKSKQALVAEFVRIHQGQYGRLRQQRAMDIVKGRAGGVSDGDQNPLTTDLSGQPISYLPPSKSAPLLAATPGKYKEEERDAHLSKSVSATVGSKRIAPSSSHYIHVPSPSIAPRAMTPGPSHTSTHPDSLAQSDLLYRRMREDIWKEASIMIERVVHEQMTAMMEKNGALRERVEQLEVHSDNLAQWIQHLNRVQDDLTQSIQSAPVPPPLLREEVMALEEQQQQQQPVSSKYSRYPVEQRSYAPTYTAAQSSPKRSYAVRRSPSPPIVTHHPSAIVARRNIGERDPHREQQQQPRDSREYYSGHSSRVAMSDPYERPYYTYPPDDRDLQHQQQQLPLSLPTHSPQHQAKRARNGY